MRQLQRIGLSVGLVLGSAGGGAVAAQGGSAGVNGTREATPAAVEPATTVPATAAPAADATRTATLLGRLHRAADSQVRLGDLAEAGAARPETRVYGAELKTQFRGLDDRVQAFAAANGIASADLEKVAPGENTVAMQRHVDDLARLANARGAAFDRDFWVAVANDQSAISDMLAATLQQDPALAGMVSDFSTVLDSSSRRAAVAAEASAPPTPPPAPMAPAPEESPPPSDSDTP